MFSIVLAIALGFFAALFVVLLAAPAAARRVSELTWRQAERVLPQSAEEIAAARDHLRGAHAMELRKLELRYEALNDRHNIQRAGLMGHLDRIAALEAATAEREQALANLQALQDETQDTLNRTQIEAAELRTISADLAVQLDTAQQEAARAQGESARNATLAERSAADLAASLARLDQTRADYTGARARIAALEAELRTLRSGAKRHDADVRHAQKKIEAMEAKLERTIRQLAETEERLERREAELKRLRAALAPGQPLRPAPIADSVAAPVAANIVPLRSVPTAAQAALDMTHDEAEIRRKTDRLRARLTDILADIKDGAAPQDLTDQMMDIAASVVAEAAAAPGATAALKLKLARSADPASALDAALRGKIKQPAAQTS